MNVNPSDTQPNEPHQKTYHVNSDEPSTNRIREETTPIIEDHWLKTAE